MRPAFCDICRAGPPGPRSSADLWPAATIRAADDNIVVTCPRPRRTEDLFGLADFPPNDEPPRPAPEDAHTPWADRAPHDSGPLETQS